ncbi:MAG: DUF6089 family protein [Ilyomonas sp.]
MKSNILKIHFLLIATFTFFSFTAKAQTYYNWDNDAPLEDIKGKYEISVFLGANNFLGDLGGNQGIGKPFVKDYTMKTIRPITGISFSTYPENFYKIGIGVNYTRVVAIDSLIPSKGGEERWRIYRNQSFRSDIIEAYANVELYPFTRLDYYRSMHRFNPFINAGIGVFYYNPKANLNGEWVALQPLHLEGQGFPEYDERKQFKRLALYIPLSAGIKYYVTSNLAFSLSATARLSNTDYIDGVSTTYINPSLFDQHLSPEKAALAKQLYSRSITPWKVKPDVAKADSKDKDSYVSVFFSVSFALQKQMKIYYGGM